MIRLSFDRKSQKIMKDLIRHHDQRMQRGQELMLLEIATQLWRAVWKQRAVVPLIGDKEWDYTRHLRVAPIDSAPEGSIAVAVWVETDAQELQAEDVVRTAIQVIPAANAEPWVQVLASWGWFPASLLPAKVPPGQGKILARSMRPQEAQGMLDHFLKHRAQMDAQLKEAKAPHEVEPTKDLRVYVDLAWEVLRAEFGLHGRQKESRWRPAIEQMLEYIPKAMEHFADYLIDGKESRFDVYDSGAVGWKQVRTGIRFQRELMPYLKGKSK